MSYLIQFALGLIALAASFFKSGKPVTEDITEVKHNDTLIGDPEPPEIK